MNEDAIAAANRLSATAFSSFSDATRAILEMLEQQLPGSAVFVGHLDEPNGKFAIIDSRGSAYVPLPPGAELPIEESFCFNLADGRGAPLCEDAAADPVYGALPTQQRLGIESYVGVPLRLSDGTAIGSLCAAAPTRDRYSESDLQLLQVMARLLAFELERESTQRRLEELHLQLREQARTDPLTGVLNRSAIEEELERAAEAWRSSGEATILVVADLDGFKALNDRRGHAAGDRVLRALTARMRAMIRPGDVIGRLGGDEFLIVLRSSEHDAIERIRPALREAACEISAGEGMQIGISVGAAALSGDPEADLHRADLAMYEDKASRARARDQVS